MMKSKRFPRVLAVLLAALFLTAAVSCRDRTAIKDEYPNHCTLYIDCKTILDNMSSLDPEKAELVPEDGVILEKVTVGFDEGDSVYDILVRELHARKIHIESEFSSLYNTAYIEGIANLYEMDCGYQSGWMFSVNGVFPNIGCSQYYPKEGDEIRFLYTCDLGSDLGNEYGEGH